VRIGVALVVWMAVVVGAAVAQRAELTEEVFDGRGDPLIVVNPAPHGSEGRVSWMVCRPHQRCVVPARRLIEADGRVLRPGRQPAGTTFVGRVTYRGHTTAVRTRRWRGRVHAAAPARLIGDPRVGAIVQAAPARWAGGWGGESEDLRVEVCAQPTSGCQTLISPNYVGPRSAQIPAQFEGWYIHVADVHVAAGSITAPVGYGRPAGVPVTHPSAQVSWSQPVRISEARP
jgi:hypothetical protein